MRLEKTVGERIGLGVEDQVDRPLTQERDALGAMLPGFDEAQALKPMSEFGPQGFVHRELQKLDPVVFTGRRCIEQ
ncbi:hypothetical protein D3C85_952730 [compost metagenome]